MNAVFLDASYAIALSVPNDQNHAKALAISQQLESRGTVLLTTPAVLFEIGNALAKQRFRKAAIGLLSAIGHDPTVEVVPLTEALYQDAFALFQQRPDKEWGLTDCLSFVVMQRRGLVEALTADLHFKQAGFQPLLV